MGDVSTPFPDYPIGKAHHIGIRRIGHQLISQNQIVGVFAQPTQNAPVGQRLVSQIGRIRAFPGRWHILPVFHDGIVCAALIEPIRRIVDDRRVRVGRQPVVLQANAQRHRVIGECFALRVSVETWRILEQQGRGGKGFMVHIRNGIDRIEPYLAGQASALQTRLRLGIGRRGLAIHAGRDLHPGHARIAMS